jgi:hypothetical protein
MSERVALAGGNIIAGAGSGGGWEVVADVPNVCATREQAPITLTTYSPRRQIRLDRDSATVDRQDRAVDEAGRV